jgi:enoyl-CoA hydratase/carnithine racemase
LNRIRFEHPEIDAVVLTSARERIFSSGANIYMLGRASHAEKVNFCHTRPGPPRSGRSRAPTGLWMYRSTLWVHGPFRGSHQPTVASSERRALGASSGRTKSGERYACYQMNQGVRSSTGWRRKGLLSCRRNAAVR